MDFKQILEAYKKCSKGKRKSIECARFGSRLGFELTQLLNDINNKRYFPLVSRCFVVTKPRPREIWAAQFRDRIVHHLIVSHLEPLWEKGFSPQSYACRKNKGSHLLLSDLSKAVGKISHGNLCKDVWVLQLDVESFFVSIDRKILQSLFLEKVTDPEIVYLIEQNFSHDPRLNYNLSGWRDNLKLVSDRKSWLRRGPDEGIPIGNLTSQFGANLYLNDLDWFVQHELKPKAYFRYMDDLLILGSTKEDLVSLESAINDWLWKNRKQRLNLEKSVLVNFREGIDYLGHRIKQVPEPKKPLLILPQKKKKWDLVREFKKLENHNWQILRSPHELGFPEKRWHREKLQTLNARLGLLSHSETYVFRKKSVQKFQYRSKGSDLLKIDSSFKSIKYDS